MNRDSDRNRARFDRQYRKIAPLVPGMASLRKPGWMIARVLVAVVFILGGFLAILPIFGLWMIPVGLLLLAIDLPALQGPVSRLLIRGRRWIALRRRR
ncbi:hypothetical protein [Yoonia vestfoldensis]|uniref:hypothetical protein n=1 Tax=Yoonia vestfoldensis TaxID=245188 RepID=UPI000362BE8A|nr:hypothetical protein [Yoonia vestfoldensis]